MIVSEQIKCDQCGALKGETNHWLLVVTRPPSPEAPGEEGIAFGPLDASVIDDPSLKIEHLCGHACAMKRFSQWLETLTSPPPKGNTE